MASLNVRLHTLPSDVVNVPLLTAVHVLVEREVLLNGGKLVTGEFPTALFQLSYK